MQLSNDANAAHRQGRLRKVRRLVSVLMGLTQEQIDRLVESLHDDHGMLTVTWLTAPSFNSKRAFEAAWEECGETARKVTHRVNFFAGADE